VIGLRQLGDVEARPAKAVSGRIIYLAGSPYDGLEHTGTLPILCPWSLMIAMRRSGSSSGLSSDMPTASTVALMTAAISSSQTKPVGSKSLWPFSTSKSSGALAISSLPSSSLQHCSEYRGQICFNSERIRTRGIGPYGANWQQDVVSSASCTLTALIDAGTSAARAAIVLKRSIIVVRAKARSLGKPFR
jgi:hypothetical protein